MAEAVLCAACRVGAGLRPRPVFRGRGIRRGRPMCRPGHGSVAGPIHGRTHRSAPTRGGRRSGATGIGAETDLANGAGRSPPPTGGGAGRRVQDGGVRATEATLAVHSSGPMYLRHGFRRPNFVPKFGASVIGIGPYENTKRRRSRHDRPGQWRRVKRLRRGCKERVGITAEIIPKVSSNLGQSLSRPLGDSSLCTREPFPAEGGEAGGHIGPPLRGHRNS